MGFWNDVVYQDEQPDEKRNVHKGLPPVEDVSTAPSYLKDFPLEEQPSRQPEAASQTDEADFDSVRVRLGDMSVLRAPTAPYERKQFDITAMAVAQTDNWLAHNDDAFIGGDERPFGDRQAYDAHKGTPGDYMFQTPDGDARGEENFAQSDVVAGPANANFFSAPRPGRVGAVRVSKAKDTMKRGLFRSCIEGRTAHEQAADNIANG